MFLKLMVLLVGVPLAELYLLFKMHGFWQSYTDTASALGITFASIIITGMIGAALARQQGFKIYKALWNKANAGEIPKNEMIEGVMILMGGALLLTPGYITDFLGFSLIIPWTRRFYRGRVTKWYEKRYTTRRAGVGGFAGGFQGDGFRRGPDGVYETTARVEPDGKLSDDR